MNNAHACALGLQRRTKPPNNSVNFKMTFVRTVNARQYLPQGAFARAIFSHERVTGSRHHVKTHILKATVPGNRLLIPRKLTAGMVEAKRSIKD